MSGAPILTNRRRPPGALSLEPVLAYAREWLFESAAHLWKAKLDAELQPLEGENGRIVEPGHCFEWAGLFETLAQWDMPEATALSDRMTRFARRHGLCPVRGVAINEVLIDGSIRNAAARLWPQTERPKAALARATGAPAKTRKGPRRGSVSGLVQVFRDARAGRLARQAEGRRLVDR